MLPYYYFKMVPYYVNNIIFLLKEQLSFACSKNNCKYIFITTCLFLKFGQCFEKDMPPEVAIVVCIYEWSKIQIVN